MAKDDYYVIAYQLLKYLYACLKKGKPPSMEVLDADYFSIGEPYWNYIIVNLSEEGYLSGAPVFKMVGMANRQAKLTEHTAITPKGILYLEENSVFQKIKDTVKDIADIVPI